ncbi:MAG: hypothetical protein OT477_16855 [Chloroflexi bacterium]|nr:hypothetical protein [Chloroflexota bacterium]
MGSPPIEAGVNIGRWMIAQINLGLRGRVQQNLPIARIEILVNQQCCGQMKIRRSRSRGRIWRSHLSQNGR